jgi:hypothetical protein
VPGAYILEGGERTRYMEAPRAAVRRPDDLTRDYGASRGRSGAPARGP